MYKWVFLSKQDIWKEDFRKQSKFRLEQQVPPINTVRENTQLPEDSGD